MNNLQKKLKNMVVMFISLEEVLEETTIDDKLSEVSGMPTFSSLSSEEIEEVGASIKSEFSIKLDKGVLIEEKNHEKWFLARKSQLDMKYWERYKKYLLADKGFSTRVVNSMDDILDTLTDLLGDPERNVRYKRRGLIIGDVQSGKTANYTGLICKAVDSGYKVVVLLTGTIERLRQQTQERIDEGFVGRDSDALIKQQEDKIVIGVGKYDSSISPVCLTSTSDDFKQKNASNLNFDLRNINGSVIFVIKKNSAVMKRLNKWLRTFNQNGDEPIDNSILVIDDEADNASVNTKNSDNPTAINGQIREMLKNFTKSSYVGFTATPFANIFIDPDSFNEMVEEDLFPKDYIYSLNAPTNYMGARNIFSEDGDASGMIVEINDDLTNPRSIEKILPLKHKSNSIVNSIPKDMEDAIAAFVLANVIQDVDKERKRTNTHRSMLINVSRFTAVQEQVSDLVNEYLKNIQSACRLYGKLSEGKAVQDKYILRLREVYDTIYADVDIDWKVIQDNLYSSCAGITVVTINQRSGKNLDFGLYKEGLRVIAVGGMSLSRGLTLEGLVISYFYRNSTMYDTLMQMGRWFGYRSGYDDLCKIWMSDESIEWYRHISEATDELRDEVKRYEDSDLTPMDFGLRVRSDINTLRVTAINKMRSTEKRECIISLSGKNIETPELLSDKQKNETNYRAVKELVEEVSGNGFVLVDKGKNRFGYMNIPVKYIIDLLEKIDVSPKNGEFNTKTIRDFICGYKGSELKKWDIAFASGKSDAKVDILGEGHEFNHPIRQISVENDGRILKMSGSKRRLGTTADGRFGLDKDGDDENYKKAFGRAKQRAIHKAEATGKPVPEKINLTQDDYFSQGIERNPLLTIYFVGLEKLTKNETEENKKVFEECRDTNYVGFGIGIPTLENQETKYARYVLNKVAIQNLFEGESWDDEEEYGD